MLIHSINNSISDQKKHFTEDQMTAFFIRHQLDTPLNRYAADVIFQEASLEEILRALKKNRIPFENARQLFSAYKKLNPEPCQEKYEWLFG